MSKRGTKRRTKRYKYKRLAENKSCKPLFWLVREPGFEPGTYRLGGGRSIQLSYKRITNNRTDVANSLNSINSGRILTEYYGGLPPQHLAWPNAIRRNSVTKRRHFSVAYWHTAKKQV